MFVAKPEMKERILAATIWIPIVNRKENIVMSKQNPTRTIIV
jgi:hypothetical protein